MNFNNTSEKIVDKPQLFSQSQLTNKGVLVIGKDAETIEALVLQFANKGADVSVICQNFSEEQMEQLETAVQDKGRELYVLNNNGNARAHLDQMMSKAMDCMGRLDLFIDLSAQKIKTTMEPKHANAYGSNWRLEKTIADELV